MDIDSITVWYDGPNKYVMGVDMSKMQKIGWMWITGLEDSKQSAYLKDHAYMCAIWAMMLKVVGQLHAMLIMLWALRNLTEQDDLVSCGLSVMFGTFLDLQAVVLSLKNKFLKEQDKVH